MTIRELLSYVDKIKPNVFSNADKTVWLNEIESRIQTEIFLLDVRDCRQYRGPAELPLHGCTFGTDWMRTAESEKVIPGARITVRGLTTCPANNSDTPRTVCKVCGGKLYFAENTFTACDTPEAGSAQALYDEGECVLLVDDGHSKLYAPYLCAMIDFANADFDKYANSMALFNAHYGEFVRWFARSYAPANRR